MLKEHPIKPYIYYQYLKYNDASAIVESYNDELQTLIDDIQGLNLPFYYDLSGVLLDFCAASVFGLKRPVISVGDAKLANGNLNQVLTNAIVVNGFLNGESSIAFQRLSDSQFKKFIAWHVFKSDGFIFNIEWLKKRIARFIANDFFDNNYFADKVSIELPARKKIPFFGCVGFALPNSICANGGVDSKIAFIDENSTWTIKITGDNAEALVLKNLIRGGFLPLPTCNSYNVIIQI